MIKYLMYMILPSGMAHVERIYPDIVQSIKIKIQKDNHVVKEIIIPITFDGKNNKSQCLNIKLDSLT